MEAVVVVVGGASAQPPAFASWPAWAKDDMGMPAWLVAIAAVMKAPRAAAVFRVSQKSDRHASNAATSHS